MKNAQSSQLQKRASATKRVSGDGDDFATAQTAPGDMFSGKNGIGLYIHGLERNELAAMHAIIFFCKRPRLEADRVDLMLTQPTASLF